jgi:hypothetical protein
MCCCSVRVFHLRHSGGSNALDGCKAESMNGTSLLLWYLLWAVVVLSLGASKSAGMRLQPTTVLPENQRAEHMNPWLHRRRECIDTWFSLSMLVATRGKCLMIGPRAPAEPSLVIALTSITTHLQPLKHSFLDSPSAAGGKACGVRSQRPEPEVSGLQPHKPMPASGALALMDTRHWRVTAGRGWGHRSLGK